MAQTSDPPELITPDWRIHGRVYRDPAVFDLELDRIFRRVWLYVAHESEIAAPGDYKTTYAGAQPVVVTRGADDGVIHVLLNRCRHRGATVCQREYGNAGSFRCSYHGWTYSNTGALIGIPYAEAYDGLRREQLGLVRLPRVASCRGFVFASFAADGPSLDEYLGNAKSYLELVAEQGPNGIELSAGCHRVRYEGNWKLQVENSIDNYHFGVVHRSFLDTLTARLGETPPIVQNIVHNPEWRTIDLGGGHSVHEFGDPRTGTNYGSLGDLPFNLIVFPNLCFVGAHLRHVLPRAVARTEVVFQPMLHRGAPEEQNARILRMHEGFYGPAGFGGSDDVEIAFNRVTDGLQATEEDWIIMSRGAGREQQGENGILIGHSADELPQRAFYRQWLRMIGEPAE